MSLVIRADPELTVDEHREVAKRAARDERGQRMDAQDSVDDQLRRARATDDQCDNAADYCEECDDACEFLVESCGFDQEEVVIRPRK